MNTQEINYALALAIGWALDTITLDGDVVRVGGRLFDYRDPSVIGPVAEHFDVQACSRKGAAMTVIEPSWLLGDTL